MPRRRQPRRNRRHLCAAARQLAAHPTRRRAVPRSTDSINGKCLVCALTCSPTRPPSRWPTAAARYVAVAATVADTEGLAPAAHPTSLVGGSAGGTRTTMRRSRGPLAVPQPQAAPRSVRVGTTAWSSARGGAPRPAQAPAPRRARRSTASSRGASEPRVRQVMSRDERRPRERRPPDLSAQTPARSELHFSRAPRPRMGVLCGL